MADFPIGSTVDDSDASITSVNIFLHYGLS